MKNIIFAIPAAASEIPPKPKIPATIAITIQIINHFIIIISFLRLVLTNYNTYFKKRFSFQLFNKYNKNGTYTL